MLTLAWIALPALAEAPQRIDVAYTVKFDLGQMADSVCSVTGICDCAVTYRGSGALSAQSGNTLTFKGTWTHDEGKCNDAFMFWVPSSGAAYHTVTLDGEMVTEWLVHASAGDTTRKTSNIKAGQQVWLSPMRAMIDPETHAASHYEKESGDAGGIGMSSEHRLTVVLTE